MIFAKHHIQSPLNPLIRFALNLSERIMVQFVDHFVFVSMMLHNYYNANYSIARKFATISPGGADLIRSRSSTTNTREALGLSSTDIVIGYVGVLDTSRELDKFLNIFYEVSKQRKNLKLIFIGDGNDRSHLTKYVCDNELNACVQFLGSIPHEKIAEYIKLFNFGLCHLPKIPVYEESYPQKIVEYLACNVPVLASNIKAHRHISQQLYGVHIYECSDDIVEIIENFNQEIYQDLRKYSYAEIAKTFVNLYNSLSSPNPIL